MVLPASAAAPDRRNQARLDSTIRFLQEIQNPDGGFGGKAGAPSDPLFSAWVAIALAAGGVNPRDQKRPRGVDVYGYVTRYAAALSKTTDFERAALVAVAAGTSPRRFGGVDLVGAILGRQLPNGAFAFEAGGSTGYVNATAFAILPLSTLREPAVDAALRRGADWLLTAQDPSGAWGYAPGVELSSDVTAAVIQALHAARRTGTPQEQRAWAYLRGLQNADGGFGFNVSMRASNTASTSWIVQAMWAAGIDPRRFAPDRPSPLDYLASQQRPDGSIAWKDGDDLNSVWMTAYAAPAYGGHPLPVPTVPRAVEAAPPRQAARGSATVTATAAERTTGHGGMATGRGIVIAGGGGRGAPLFSRPQPQSQGHTTDGVRNVRDAGGRGGRRMDTNATRTGDAASDGDPQVTGVVLGDTTRTSAAAAPGLQGAQAGGRARGPAWALALTGALLLCTGLGVQLERRRPGVLA